MTDKKAKPPKKRGRPAKPKAPEKPKGKVGRPKGYIPNPITVPVEDPKPAKVDKKLAVMVKPVKPRKKREAYTQKIDWDAAKLRYVMGVPGDNEEVHYPSLTTIAAMFKVNAKAVQNKAAAENWTGARAKHQAALSEARQQVIFEELRRRAAEESKGYFDASSLARQAVARRLERDALETRAAYQLEPGDISKLMSGLRASQQVFHISLGLPADGMGASGGSAPLWEPFGTKRDKPVLSDRLGDDDDWIEGESLED